jgi:hypothetical protein
MRIPNMASVAAIFVFVLINEISRSKILRDVEIYYKVIRDFYDSKVVHLFLHGFITFLVYFARDFLVNIAHIEGDSNELEFSYYLFYFFRYFTAYSLPYSMLVWYLTDYSIYWRHYFL